MSTEHPPESFDIRAVLRGLGLYLLLASVPAVLVFLYGVDLLDAYHGVAACHRPLPHSDGLDDRLLRFVLVRSGQEDIEVRLPAAALARYPLPRCPDGIPGRTLPEGAPTIHKDSFSLHFTVDGRSWPTPWPGDLLLPLVLILAGLPVRNWWATGSPLRIAGRVQAPRRLGEDGAHPPPSRAGGAYGPPPRPRRKGRPRR